MGLIRTMPIKSAENIFMPEGPYQQRITPSASMKEMADRITSADTDSTNRKSQGQKRLSQNKFQIGGPSNYDKIKSTREQKTKEKHVTKLLQAPDPVCNRFFDCRCFRGLLQKVQSHKRLLRHSTKWRRNVQLLLHKLAFPTVIRRLSLHSSKSRRDH